MTELLLWSDECQRQWQMMHEHALEKDTKAVANYMLFLVIALQKAQQQKQKVDAKQVIPFIAARLRNCDSPIYLLAQKVETAMAAAAKKRQNECKFHLPIVEKNNKIVLQPMPFQLFVQLENFAQHREIIQREWETDEKHSEALSQCGFLFIDD